MKIKDIHIDGFGVWADRTWGDLSPGVNVFYGPNETGKSTLMAFVRAMLFGFDKRGSSRRYEPLKGGVHGGWLDLDAQERSIRLERKTGRHVRGAVSVYDGDTVGGEEVLDKLLSGTTKTLYHNVFAFGLEELQQFQTLQENEVAQHITGAGLGIGAARWSAVQRDLEDRQSALFLPRGQTSAINVALKELEGVREELDRTEHQPEDYWAAHESRMRLSAEVAGLEEAVVELKQRVSHYEIRLKARPLWEKRRKIEARLQELPVVENFPEGGIERLDLLRRQCQNLLVEKEQFQRDIEDRRLRRIELHSMTDPEQRSRRVQALESLRNLAPRVEAVRRVTESAAARRAAALQEKETFEATLHALEPPARSSFLMFLGLMWLGAAGLGWAGHEYIAAVTLAVSLSPVLWYRQRVRGFGAITLQFESCLSRLEAATTELRIVEKEGRAVEAEVRNLTGKTEVAQSDIDARVADLEHLEKISDDIRRMDEAAERAEADLERVGKQMGQLQNGIQALLDEAATATEEEFVRRAGIFKQRVQLLTELDKLPVDGAASGLLFDVRVAEEEAYELTARELVEMEQRLIDARHESGRVEERIAVMERSEERSRALARQETIHAKIDGASDLWAVLTLCRTLLDETRKIYENDRQPEVLRQASLFYSIMTQGAYLRVIAPLDGTELQVERADGVRLSPQVLSRGTAEQLYLAMRMALVREYAHHVDPLPVVFDDVFVNFDPERTKNTIHAVRELAESHQILIFTCHPHLVQYLKDIVPDVKTFPLN